MKLNPTKCKEMVITFLQNNNAILRPILVGNNTIERVTSYKTLGIILTNDLSWNNHVDYILKKASKKLYSLRMLYRARVEPTKILKVYLTTIRPVVEYAVPVWQAIPDYLSNALESVQKRALRIIFPKAETYAEALRLAEIKTLAERRQELCIRYMNKMRQEDHPLNHLLPTPIRKPQKYNMRHVSKDHYLYRNALFCRTKRAESFFTFKYF